MDKKTSLKKLLSQLPYTEPFLFVDDVYGIDGEAIEGSYTFKDTHGFYKGHFKGNPVTPGVILTECCAQIGLVCMGLYLNGKSNTSSDSTFPKIALSSSEMEFYIPVFPNEKVVVRSKKIYFRFQKLKCAVKMYNAKNELVCKGVLAGMIQLKKDEK